jgi:pyruvate kinase
MANNLGARAIFCFTRRGYMASALSRLRPDCPIFAFTDTQETRQRLNLRWGVMPYRLELSGDPGANIERAFMVRRRAHRSAAPRAALPVVRPAAVRRRSADAPSPPPPPSWCPARSC